MKFSKEIDECIAINDGGKSYNSAQYWIPAHPPFHLFNELIFRVYDGKNVGFSNPALFSVVREDGCELVAAEMDRHSMFLGDYFQLFPEEIQPIINACIVVFRLGVTGEVSCFFWSEDGDCTSLVVHNRAFSPSVDFSSIWSSRHSTMMPMHDGCACACFRSGRSTAVPSGPARSAMEGSYAATSGGSFSPSGM